MMRAYTELHRLGWAHSAEAWLDGRLVGGLYGVSIGRLFCGESMFAHADDASKIAFVTLVRQMQLWEIATIDCQVPTDHLARFGARRWPRRAFLRAVRELTSAPSRPGPWTPEPAQGSRNATPETDP
jgi:leucyl/phenylalanyl-tRNA--protein transferase